MKNPAASSGISKKTHYERNCRVGGGAKRRYPPGGGDGYRGVYPEQRRRTQPILRWNRGAASCGELTRSD